MSYNVKEAAAKVGISPHTLRYYSKIGLIPFIERNDIGNRQFTEEDIASLSFIVCLKKSGMPLKDIQEVMDNYFDINKMDDCERLLKQHRDNLRRQIDFIEDSLELIDSKIWLFDLMRLLGPENIQRLVKEQNTSLRNMF